MKTVFVDWKCERCRRKGEAEIQNDFSLNQIIFEIVLAHEEKSPRCKVESHMVNEVIERPIEDENNNTNDGSTGSVEGQHPAKKQNEWKARVFGASKDGDKL